MNINDGRGKTGRPRRWHPTVFKHIGSLPRNVAQVNGRVRIAHILMRSEMQVQVLPFRLALWLSKHPTCMDALRKRRGKPRVTRSHSARTVMFGQFIRFPPLTEIRGA